MMWVWTLTFILLSSVSILNGNVLKKASSTSTPHRLQKRDSSLPYDRWMSISANHLKEGVRVKKGEEKEGRWIELIPVSSPLAATREQMLTLGLKITPLRSCSNLTSPFVEVSKNPAAIKVRQIKTRRCTTV